MTTGERIRQARKELRLTQQQLADLTGVDRTLIARYERNDIQDIPLTKLTLLAKHLGRGVAWLIDESPESSQTHNRASRALEEAAAVSALTPRQLEHLAAFFAEFKREAAPRRTVDREAIVRLTAKQREAALQQYTQPAKIHRLPVLEVNHKAAAGGAEFSEIPQEFLHLSQHRWQPGYRPFQIVGDSMTPYIMNGDYVVVDVKREPVEGDVVLARTPDGLVVKRYFPHKDHVELVSMNPGYAPMRLEEVAILGVLIDIVRPVKKIVDS